MLDREGISEEKTKRTQKVMYFIDYKQFVDIVKWKIHFISKKMEKEIASVIEFIF